MIARLMKRKRAAILFFALSSFSLWAQAVPEEDLAKSFADYQMSLVPDPARLNPEKGWEYTSSIVLFGIYQVYLETGDRRYLNYVKGWVDHYLLPDGTVRYRNEANVDTLHPGLLVLALYKELKDPRYLKALGSVLEKYDTHPRNSFAGFWHKTRYPGEMWLDGIYMAQDFAAAYADFSGQGRYFDEACRQILLLAAKAQDPSTGLLRHAWDAEADAFWADPKSGLSPQVWARAMGWYMVALVDVLALLPKDHASYPEVLRVFRAAAAGLVAFRDPKSGLWYQVLDGGDRAGNWIETSASALFVYALKRACDLGLLGAEYADSAGKAWASLKARISWDAKGFPHLGGAAPGMGVQASFEDYVNKTPQENSPHLLFAMMMTAVRMEGSKDAL